MKKAIENPSWQDEKQLLAHLQYLKLPHIRDPTASNDGCMPLSA